MCNSSILLQGEEIESRARVIASKLSVGYLGSSVCFPLNSAFSNQVSLSLNRARVSAIQVWIGSENWSSLWVILGPVA